MAWPQLAAAWPSIQEQIDRFHRLSPLAKLVLMLFVGAFVVYGSTKTNGVGGVDEDEPRCAVGRGLRSAPEMESTNSSPAVAERHALPVCDYPPPTVTPEDIARGWQLWEVRTNAEVCYTMPEGAMMAGNWWVRGAYEDVVRVPGSEFQVPLREQ